MPYLETTMLRASQFKPLEHRLYFNKLKYKLGMEHHINALRESEDATHFSVLHEIAADVLVDYEMTHGFLPKQD